MHSSNHIIKLAEDTTLEGLISGNDETAYRMTEEVLIQRKENSTKVGHTSEKYFFDSAKRLNIYYIYIK